MLAFDYRIIWAYFLLTPIFSLLGFSLVLNYILLAFYLLSCFFAVIYYFKLNNHVTSKSVGIIIVIFLSIEIVSWLVSPKILMFSGQTFNTEGVEEYRRTSTQLVASIQVMLTYFLFYYITYKKKLNLYKISKFGRSLFYVALFCYIIGFFSMDTESIEATRHGFANNAGYRLVMLLPLLSLKSITNSKFLKYFVLIFCLVLLSAKRGAILAMGIITLIWIYYAYLKHSSFKNKIYALILLLFVTAASVYIVETNDNLRTKFEDTREGKSSGRDVMYLLLIEKWLNSTEKEKILGIQYNASYTELGVDAHNDWLELLTGQGLAGVFFYLVFFICLISYYKKNNKYLRKCERFTFVMIVIIWIVKSFMSQVFYGGTTSYFMIVLGYLMATIDCRKFNLNRKSYYDTKSQNIISRRLRVPSVS